MCAFPFKQATGFSQIAADSRCIANLFKSCTESQINRDIKIINYSNISAMKENEISYLIRGAIFRTYNRLGPGLLESAYESALAHELIKEGINVKSQVGLPFYYDEIKLEIGYRLDLLVENCVIVEVKSVDALADVHFKQVLTYLKLSGIRLGILVNFNTSTISSSIKRIVNNL
jgi:GxxExxY protein